MPVPAVCPECQRTLKIADASVGKTVKCPGCGARFVAAAAEDPPAAPAKPKPPGGKAAAALKPGVQKPQEGPAADAKRAPAATPKSAPKPAAGARGHAPPEGDEEEDERRPAGKQKRPPRKRRARIPLILQLLLLGVLSLLIAVPAAWAIYVFVLKRPAGNQGAQGPPPSQLTRPPSESEDVPAKYSLTSGELGHFSLIPTVNWRS